MSISEVKFTMVGHGPIVFGKPVHEQKRDDETHQQLEERTWTEKAHVDHEGRLYVPAVAVHRSLIAAGAWLSQKLSGNKTFTQRFKAGLLCHKPEFTINRNGQPLSIKDIERLDLYVPSDGKQGGTKRVWRSFPRLLPSWSIDVTMLLTDEAISEDVFAKHAKCAGLHDGIGSMRIGKGGPNGLWELANLRMSEYTM